MDCNCKDMRREIEEGKNTIAVLRELFIKRMTVICGECELDETEEEWYAQGGVK